jgi:hypothetical protein
VTVEFGLSFAPRQADRDDFLAPPVPPSGLETGEEVRHKELLGALHDIATQVALLDLPDVPAPAHPMGPGLDPAAVAYALRDGLAQALAEQNALTTDALAKVVERLTVLGRQVAYAGSSGGGSSAGHVTVDGGLIALSQPVAISGTVPVSGVLTDAELRASPVPVSGTISVPDNFQREVFGSTLVGERSNQIEVHFDDSNWSSYGTETRSGGAPVGAQSQGRVAFTTGTGLSGTYRFVTTDVAKYRPLHEVYGAATARFITPPTAATDSAYVGLLGDYVNGNWVAVGYKGTTFGISYWRNGAEVMFLPQALWDDPCLGAAGSAFTAAGSAVTLDPSDPQIYLVECGLLGYAGFVVKVFSPDFTWVPVLTVNRLNAANEPVFSNFDLYQFVALSKSASDATNITVHSACWAAGATSTRSRLSDPLSTRSLVTNVQSVIAGQSTAGGGSFPTVKVSPSGALQTELSSNLVSRMNARQPQDNYTLWLDVTSSDSTRIYIAEAPAGTAAGTASFQGIRITLDASGNPLGAVETATAFAWNSRSAATWAS